MPIETKRPNRATPVYIPTGSHVNVLNHTDDGELVIEGRAVIVGRIHGHPDRYMVRFYGDTHSCARQVIREAQAHPLGFCNAHNANRVAA